jgi:hypothetical protein
MASDLARPSLELLAELTVNVAEPIEIGDTPGGSRRVIPITGGTVSGPGLRGRVLAAGADFQIVHPADGTAWLDARYVLALDDGTHVFVVNRALRRASPEVTARLMRGEAADPSQVYFRCQPQFETPAGPWRWLMEHVFVGTGVRRPDCVEMAFYRLT